MYDFKVREVINVLDQKVNAHININEKRFRHRAETADAIFYVSAKVKIYYDFRHQSLLFKSSD